MTNADLETLERISREYYHDDYVSTSSQQDVSRLYEVAWRILVCASDADAFIVDNEYGKDWVRKNAKRAQEIISELAMASRQDEER